MPPISQLDLHLTQHPPQQSNQWCDPFISPRAHASSSQRIDIHKANPSIVPAPQARHHDKRDSSAAYASGQNASFTGKRTLVHDSYEAGVHRLSRSSNDSTPLGPLSSTSTSFSANQDDRSCEGRDSGRDDTSNEAEENIKRKRKVHAISEKDRREVSNLFIRNLKKVMFPDSWKVASRAPHNKEEAKNEILRHSEAFIMGLMHQMALLSAYAATMEQEIWTLHKEMAALMQENKALGERFNSGSSCAGSGQKHKQLPSNEVISHGDRRTSSNQPASYTASMPGAGACLFAGNRDWSSMKHYHDCFKTRGRETWLQSVIDTTRDIASLRNDALTKVVDAARSRGEPLTKDLLDRSLD